MRIVSCLEWLTCLFLFTIRLNLKVTVQLRLNNGTHFSGYESPPKRVQCFNLLSHEILRHATVGFIVAWVCTAAPSTQKKSPRGSPVKLAFRRFLFSIVSLHAVCSFNQSSTFYFFKSALAFREGAEDFEGGTYWQYFGKKRSRKNYWRQDASSY